MGRLKTFEIIFDDNRTVYYPSQTLTGKCVIDLKGDMKMRCLNVFMKGVAKVHWTESRSTGNRLGAYTEHFNAEIEYFLKRQQLFGAENCIVEDVLQKGHHEFRFSFQLPTSGIATSFEGKHGSIRYWLKAEIERMWSFNNTAKKAFTVITPIDINRSEYLMPVLNLAESTLCCWCCTSGPISIYARTDRRGYCPGESIAITADFENLSRRTIIPHATLYQCQTFVANGKTRSRRNKFTTVTGVAIQPGRTANWDAQLLKIPAVSPSILNCCLIRVDYSVQITLQIPCAYNLFVDLPIVVGTTPYRCNPSYGIHSELDALLQSQIGFMALAAAPPYQELETPPPSLSTIEPPPSYAECVEGSVDIAEDEEGLVGDTSYTPLYTYVHNYQYHPPPAYSEVDPNPQLSLTLIPSSGGQSESQQVVIVPLSSSQRLHSLNPTQPSLASVSVTSRPASATTTEARLSMTAQAELQPPYDSTSPPLPRNSPTPRLPLRVHRAAPAAEPVNDSMTMFLCGI